MHPTLVLLLGVLCPLALAQSKCYYPDGNEATDYKYYPCNGVNTTFSQCCLLDEGDQCLPNGLCYFGRRNYDYRAACSDRSWEACSNACPGVLNDTWIHVKACTTDQFCCNEDIDNGDCCTEGGKRFKLPAPEVTTSAAPSSSTGSESPSSTDDGPNPQDPNPSDPNPRDPSPSDPNPQNKDNDSNGGGGGGLSTGAQGAIGGSIGGVALIAIGLGAFWFLRKRKGKKGGNKAAELGSDGAGAGVDEKKGYWAGGHGQSPQQPWAGPPAEVEGSQTAIESGGREVPQRYELGG